MMKSLLVKIYGGTKDQRPCAFNMEIKIKKNYFTQRPLKEKEVIKLPL